MPKLSVSPSPTHSNRRSSRQATPAHRALLLLGLLALATACAKTRKERVKAWLSQRGFEQIELEQKNGTSWTFRAKREGIRCDGTAEILEIKKGYNTREKFKGDWYCGQ